MAQKLYTTFGFFKVYAAATCLLALGLLWAWYAGHEQYLLPGLVLLVFFTALISFRVLQLIYKLQLDRIHDVNQVDALLWNYAQFVPGVKLPAMRVFAGSPDFLSILIEQTKFIHPKVIVEAGSGVSSIVLSELLMSSHSDAVHIALDHEQQYADATRRKIRNPNSRIVLAPLRDYTIDGKSWKWYDLDQLPETGPIDLLIIDGPPEKLQAQARYPALPLLLERLSPHAVVLVDDANRKDDTAVVKRWMTEYGLRADYERTEKGTYILRR